MQLILLVILYLPGIPLRKYPEQCRVYHYGLLDQKGIPGDENGEISRRSSIGN